jgi:hypothetical protein
MNDFREFLIALNEDNEFLLTEAKLTFKQPELTPVMFGKPGSPGAGGGGGGLPPALGTKPDKVEVINIGGKQPPGPPQPHTGKGDAKPGESIEMEVKNASEIKGGEKGEKKAGTCPTCGGTGHVHGPHEKGKESGGGKGKGEEGGGGKGKGKGGGKEGEAEGGGEGGEEGDVCPTCGGTGKAPQKIGQVAQQPTKDSHAILNTSDAGETKDMAEKILEKAEQMRQERNVEGRGEGEGGYIEKLAALHKPKINWAQELRKKITEFKSRSAATINRFSQKPAERYKSGEGIQKTKSYFTYLRDPKSHVKQAGQPAMIFKGPFVKAPISEIVLIVAMDTSGSIGKDTVTKVFTEMDKIANSFKRGFSAGNVKLEGRVYFMTWDTAVYEAMEYKPGDWKNIKFTGGGGTDLASSLFAYLKEHTLFDKEKPTAALLNIIKGKMPSPTGMSKDDIIIPIKGGADAPQAIISPFLIICTDGDFGNVTDGDLGLLFKDNKKNVLYLIIDGTEESCYPKNVINYESYRV